MGIRKELKDFRTIKSKRFIKPDGSIEIELYKEPIHYIDNDGKYQDIDNTLEQTKTGIKNKKNDFIVSFDNQESDKLLDITFYGKKISVFPKKMDKKNINKNFKKDNKKRCVDKIRYDNILDKTDIEYEVQSKRVKETIILHSLPKTNVLEFVINTDLNLILNTNNTISAFDNNKEIFVIEKPFMIDDKKNYSDNIKYELAKSEKNYELKIVLDKDWIGAKERKYPIVIDPTISGIEDINSVIDSYIYNGDEGAITYNLNKLLVGTNENNISYRSLLKFNLPIIPPGYRMVNAELTLYSYPKYSDIEFNDKKIVVHKINKQWEASNAKWTNMNDAYDNKIYDYTLSTNSLYYVENDETKINWGGTSANVTQLVQEWYNDPSSNNGLLLKWQDESYSATNEICEFVSSECLENNDINSTKPLLKITYKDFNGLEEYLPYTSQNHSFGTTHINNYTGNLTNIFYVGNTIGGVNPIELYFVYNTNDVISNKNYGCGLGVKPNFLQTLEEDVLYEDNEDSENTTTYEIIKYLDENGTNHYFYKQENDKYVDEDGLGLTISYENDKYLMEDENGNINKFGLRDNIYYLEEIKDTSNNTTTINYDNYNRIVSITDSINQVVTINYEDNVVRINSPHAETIVNLTNNLLSSITSLGNTEIISYTNDNLIEKITNANGLSNKFEYLNDTTRKISKISEISKNNNVGNFLNFEYNLADTKITDNKGLFNTYIFNSHGNVIGITSIGKTNKLSDAYGKSYSFGEEENVNKLVSDKSLIKYVNNMIDDSSFEGEQLKRFTNGDLNTTNRTSTAYARSGLQSLQVDIPRGGGYLYNDYTVEKGKNYTFSGYLRGVSLVNSIEETNLEISLSYDNIEKKTIVKELTNEFIRFSVTIEYDENAVDDLRLTIRNVYDSPTSFFLDDIQLEEGQVANYYNLITNSNFLNGDEEWNISITPENEEEELGGATVSVVSLDDSNNEKALKIHSFPSDNVYITKVFNVSGKAGDTFNLSFWYKNEGIIPSGYIGHNAGIWANIFFHYGDDYLEGTGIPAKILNVGSNNWQFLSQNFIAEADYENITLQILSSCNANDCYFSNFSLFKDLEQYSYGYDENGQLISITNLDKSNDSISYNSNNQLIQATDPAGKNYNFEYDKTITDRIIRATTPSGITNHILYDENGNPTKTRIYNRKTFDNINNSINYYLRAKGSNKYFFVNPDKTLRIKENECSYDKFNIIVEDDNVKICHSILNNYYLKENDGILNLTYGDYNNEFKLYTNTDKSYSIIKENVVSEETIELTAITIDEQNNLILNTYEDTDNQKFFFEQSNDNMFIESRAEYTQDGRFISKVIDSLDNETNYEYDTLNGIINKITDANGTTTEYTYDNKNRLNTISKGNQSVNYEYDEYNNLNKINFGNKQYVFGYDEFNNDNSLTINGNNILTSYYGENNGNLTKEVYGNNDEIKYEYNSLDQLQKLIKMDNEYSFEYDNLGRLVQISSSDNEHLYEYDFSKRLSSYSSNNYKVEYDYGNKNDVIKKKEYTPIGNYLYEYNYNDESLITKINHDDTDYNYIYDSLGRLVEANINENYKFKYEYITKGKKTSSIIEKVNDNGTIYSYKYDKIGNIVEIRKNDEVINKYYYDSNSQLIKEENTILQQIIEYNYNNIGNILSKKVYNKNTNLLESENTYEYNENRPDLLSKYNNELISYDSVGNCLMCGDKNFTWKNGHELASYTDSINSITYKYNKDGIRTSKTVNGLTTTYSLEGNSIVVENKNGNVIYYIYNEDELLGFIYKNNKYYYHKNIFNDIIGIMDENYCELVTYNYDSWGKLINTTDLTSIDLANINPFRYRSYYYDSETELYYLNTRYYDPSIGRFISSDEVVGIEQNLISYNSYQYSFNNPIIYYDDNGNMPKWAKGLIKAAVTITVCAVASAVLPGVGGVIAGAALNGALTGAVGGAVVGGAVAGISHAVSKGSTDGLGKAVLQGMCQGAGDGALEGAVISGVTSAAFIKSGATTIVNSAHGSKAHKMLSNLEAGKMVNSGSYDQVMLNTGLNKAGLNTVGGKNLKPDVIGVGVKNKIVEVVSAKQSIKYIEKKVKSIQSVNKGLEAKTVKCLRKIFKFIFGK